MIENQEDHADSLDPSTRAELLLLSPSFLVPCLVHDKTRIWDTLAIAEYLNELKPEANLSPTDRTERARCRSISGEMHSGFSNLRSALPMNCKAHYPKFKLWAGARPDVDRIEVIWMECLKASKGPYLFGAKPCMADAMFAPAATPMPIVERLHQEMRKIMTPEMQKRAADIGLLPLDSPSVDGIRTYIKSEQDKWGSLVRDLGLAGSQ